jgi:hypothetical protein
MIKRGIGAWLAVAVLLAGCGNSAPSTTHAASTAASHPTAPTAVSPTAGGAAITRSAELASCVSTAARSGLSVVKKAAYVTLCREAINGSGASVKASAASQCRQIIHRTVPAAAFVSVSAYCPKA